MINAIQVAGPYPPRRALMVSVSDRVHELDLEPIIVKLMDSEDGKGWSIEHAQITVGEYRKFLVLVGEEMQKQNPDPVVPWGGVDEVWHTHILDTEKYQQDCDFLFGRFLHHFPYYGMRGEADRTNLVDSARRTLERVIAKYGEFRDGMVLRQQVPLTCTGLWCGGTLVGTDESKLRSSVRPRLSSSV